LIRKDSFDILRIYHRDGLYLITGSIVLIAYSFFISRLTANNDIYMQLLALEDILVNFDFSDVGGHPIGIALVSLFLKVCGADPLVVFYYLQPFLSAICFVLLFKMLITVIPNKFAFFIALSSMTSLIIIKSMNQVTAEIIALTSILILMAYVWKIMVLKNNINLSTIMCFVMLSWVVILFRNASLFIIVGILLFLYLRDYFGRIPFIMISLSVLVPMIIKSLFSMGLQSHYQNIFSLDAGINFITEMMKHMMNLTEIIIPYSLNLNSIPWLKLLIGLCCISICLIIHYNKDINESYGKRYLFGEFYLIIGLSYYCILSFASVYLGSNSIFNTSWGDNYRVSGFGIIFLLTAFWIYVLCLNNSKKKYILIFLVLLSLTKISYGLRYEIIAQKHRFLFNDYRKTVESVWNFMRNEGENDRLLIYTFGGWEGKNLYYMLKYYDLIYSLPFQVERYVESDGYEDVIILCAYPDLDNFNKNYLNYSSINNLDGVYSIDL